MSAETLRLAASLMRERAENAARELGEPATDPLTWRGIGTGYREPIKEHIASWHPAVALAVADGLEETAKTFGTPGHRWWHPSESAALAVARAYLGEAS